MNLEKLKEQFLSDNTLFPTYPLAVRCVNCDHREIMQIPKGQTYGQCKCPECGCKTIIKS